MLYINHKDLDAATVTALLQLQQLVTSQTSYSAQVSKAKSLWDTGRRTNQRKEAFGKIREKLSSMCIGSVRCAYCEDSAADEVEHIYPKSILPDRAFLWSNYLFACGPCNGPKNSRFGVLQGKKVVEFIRKPKGPVIPPPPGICALIDPRIEDPTDLLELDLGGTALDGTKIEPTFMFIPREGISDQENARADFSIDVLSLNREIVRKARENAFTGFRARIREYVGEKSGTASQDQLERLQLEILGSPHLTVFDEMRRQRRFLPEIDQFFDRAPEMLNWDIVTP
ncbi:hypothetical protein [Duganella violaceipulchra]|uniref:5-methylcytosine-specific restriction endonuclease McrA n=1 Tax=Duganella violaceipulchra TaxID=2849652 RepID=A0AA41H9U0_9BURK|nr:hypothetical protein [Duganella violaceicalia]MBV6320912.1 hypothetical protein [Duganella violaceicalia]MCP2008377.1 5-methylcytosine-specific restriction endonuclease McrA [Duganella violaceicalia]